VAPNIRKIANRIAQVGSTVTVYTSFQNHNFRVEAYIDPEIFQVGSVIDLNTGNQISAQSLREKLGFTGWDKLRHKVENAAMTQQLTKLGIQS
jgi:predicted MPP superfamily phosphohydrolase